MPDMVEIFVRNKFDLLAADGTTRSFAPGRHKVTGDVASHWFVQANIEQPKPEEPAATVMTAGDIGLGDEGAQEEVQEPEETQAPVTEEEEPEETEAPVIEPTPTPRKKNR